jgi:hypothetical protein
MKNEKPPIFGFILAGIFGLLPGIGFALSLYVALAIVTWLGRITWLIH